MPICHALIQLAPIRTGNPKLNLHGKLDRETHARSTDSAQLLAGKLRTANDEVTCIEPCSPIEASPFSTSLRSMRSIDAMWTCSYVRDHRLTPVDWLEIAMHRGGDDKLTENLQLQKWCKCNHTSQLIARAFFRWLPVLVVSHGVHCKEGYVGIDRNHACRCRRSRT